MMSGSTRDYFLFNRMEKYVINLIAINRLSLCNFFSNHQGNKYIQNKDYTILDSTSGSTY